MTNDDAHDDVLWYTHLTARTYDDGKTFDVSAWAACAVDDAAKRYIDD